MGRTRPGYPGFMAVCPFSWLNNLIMEQIVFSSEQIWQMTCHLSHCLPAEGCGLIGGDVTYHAHLVIPIANLLSSPSHFRMDEREQLAAFLTLEEKGLDLIAIYHSHPSGLPVPSITDITEFFYPQSLTHRIPSSFHCSEQSPMTSLIGMTSYQPCSRRNNRL